MHDLIAGWTSSAATAYCYDYIASSAAAKMCRAYVETRRYTDSCHSDLLFSGNSRIASLHLKNLKEDCRQVIQTDKSLFLKPDDKEDIFDSLCLSSCSGHGACHGGNHVSCRHSPFLKELKDDAKCIVVIITAVKRFKKKCPKLHFKV